MAKIAFVVLALVVVAAAKPLGLGGAVVSKNHQVSSSVINPWLGLGQHVVSSSHVGSVLPHYGLGLGYGIGLGGIGGLGGLGGIGGLYGGGLGMKGLYGMYPGGIGMSYGLLG